MATNGQRKTTDGRPCGHSQMKNELIANDWNGWNCLEMYGIGWTGWKLMEWLDMAGNGWEIMEMAGNGNAEMRNF